MRATISNHLRRDLTLLRTIAAVVGSLALLAGACQGSNNILNPAAQCTFSGAEWPPSACAIVVGAARNSAGLALPGLLLSVDSTVPNVGYVYASNPVITDTSGHFKMTVYRIRIQPHTEPDTATIGLKAFAVSSWSPGQPPLAQAYVLMRFVPFGTTVPISQVEAILPLDH
jgi:hypothetical protein